MVDWDASLVYLERLALVSYWETACDEVCMAIKLKINTKYQGIIGFEQGNEELEQ